MRRRRRATQDTPGGEARRRRLTQTSENDAPPTVDEYARDLIKGELTQRLFALTQKIHKKLPEEVSVKDIECLTISLMPL